METCSNKITRLTEEECKPRSQKVKWIERGKQSALSTTQYRNASFHWRDTATELPTIVTYPLVSKHLIRSHVNLSRSHTVTDLKCWNEHAATDYLMFKLNSLGSLVLLKEILLLAISSQGDAYLLFIRRPFFKHIYVHFSEVRTIRKQNSSL